MALKPDSPKRPHEDNDLKNKLGIKVEGDLGDLQIFENREGSDNECSDDEKCVDKYREHNSTDTVTTIPVSLIKTGHAPVVNNTAINNSKNVQFGNNTYFHGPVVIKQIISKRGVENASYTPTDAENENVVPHTIPDKTKFEASVKKFVFPTWARVVASVGSIFILGLLCALGLYIQSQNQDENPPDIDPDASVKETNVTKVVGMSYDNIQIILFTIIVVPITILFMLYSLLTNQNLDGVVKNCRANGVPEQPKISIYPQADFNASIEPTVARGSSDTGPLLASPNHLTIVSRTDWLAQPVEGELSRIRQPVPWVVITHTATEGCTYQSQCVLRVRLIQMFHIESKQWDDIGYNFLVAGDGSAYFGRGWDYIGAHTLGYNRYSIGIAFIGTFNNEVPPKKQIEACKKLIKLGVQEGKIAKDYKLFGHRQLKSTLSPGDKLYDIIKEWPHFVKEEESVQELIPSGY